MCDTELKIGRKKGSDGLIQSCGYQKKKLKDNNVISGSVLRTHTLVLIKTDGQTQR